MGFFDSQSESSQTDTTVGLDDSPFVAQLSGVSVKKGSLEVNIEQVDPGVIAAAEGFAERAFVFADSSLDAAADISVSAIDLVDRQTVNVIDAITRATQESLDFAGGIVSGSLDAVSRAGESALAFVDDTMAQAFAFGEQSLSFAAGAQAESFVLVDELAGDSLAFASDLTGTALIAQADTSQVLLDAIDRIQARESTNTDARFGDLVSTMIKGLLFVSAGALGLALITR